MSDTTTLQRIVATPASLRIEWGDGDTSEFASVWLRDNLREDRDAHSGQRLVDIADLPAEPRIRSAVEEDGRVRIEWESEARSACFDLDWLAMHAFARAPRRPELAINRWLEGATLDAARDFARMSLAEARANRAARLQWLTRLLQDGV